MVVSFTKIGTAYLIQILQLSENMGWRFDCKGSTSSGTPIRRYFTRSWIPKSGQRINLDFNSCACNLIVLSIDKSNIELEKQLRGCSNALDLAARLHKSTFHPSKNLIAPIRTTILESSTVLDGQYSHDPSGVNPKPSNYPISSRLKWQGFSRDGHWMWEASEENHSM